MSGFRMVLVHLCQNNSQPFENRTKMSGFQMVNHHFDVCGPKPFKNRTILEPAHLDHSKTELVQYSDGYCSWDFKQSFEIQTKRLGI